MDVKSKVEAYLELPLPDFARGSGDCSAFVSGWVNELVGEPALPVGPVTFGQAMRLAREVEEVTERALVGLGFTKAEETPEEIPDGSVLVIAHESALAGKTVAIAKEGKAVTRTEEGLFVVDAPSVISCFLIPKAKRKKAKSSNVGAVEDHTGA